jgi:amidase
VGPDIELGSVTIGELELGLAAGRWTSRDLVDAHIEQAGRLDGPFGSLRCLVPDAREQAEASDRIRRQDGARSPLEGIPVLIKDNVDVAGLPTTAGALALEHSVPAGDAHLVTRLREAGAVILGKTNLSELANFLTDGMPSGYSSLGGQVFNPYDTALTPSGSSSGSAAAVALGLAPVSVGSETDGSITSPAEHQSLVGFKPTLGLVSRHGMLPIAPSQDTAGPLARTVTDAAALLAVIAGTDRSDPATSGAGPAAAAVRALALDPSALRGVRLGVVRIDGPPGGAGKPEGGAAAGGDPSPAPDRGQAPGIGGDPAPAPDPGRQACHLAALEALRAAGAITVDVSITALDEDDELAVLHYEFAPAVDRYLAALGPAAPVRTLADLRGWNLAHSDRALKFGQSHVDNALAVDHAAGRPAYEQARERDRLAAETGLLVALDAGVEALVFPGADGATWAARAGWPSVVIPAGYSSANRRPVGIMLVSPPWTDARLLNLAFALGRAHPVRRAPWDVNPAAFRSL